MLNMLGMRLTPFSFPSCQQLLGLYAIIALAFWASPTAQLDKVDGLVG